jgi:hypothetical protein
MTVAGLVAHVEHFQHRVIQDALAEATAAYWRRRADQFDAAQPRPGDYLGGGQVGGTGYYPAPPGSSPAYWFPGPRAGDGLCPGITCLPQTPVQLAVRHARLAAVAEACRHRADLALLAEEVWEP